MKYRLLLLSVLFLAGCQENHQHDGVYISEQPIMGVMKTWIVEGNALTSYMMGVVKVSKCKQYEDRIEFDKAVYRFDESGNLLVPNADGKVTGEKLIKRSTNTKVTTVQLERMIDEAMPPPAVLQGSESTQ